MINWVDVFEYYDGKLLWKISSGTRARPGKVAGSICSTSGYWKIKYKGKKYLEHRIIYEMHYGPIPEGYEIDHINHDRIDNRIENLRLANRSINCHNLSMMKNNTSGVTGVSYEQKVGKWRAQIRSKLKYRFLGYFDTFEEAVTARKQAETKFGFHSNHGL